MKRLIYIALFTVLFNNVSILAEGGRAGGGPSVIIANTLQDIQLNDYMNIDLIKSIDTPIKINLGDTLIVTNPLMINTIIMNNGVNIDYPEKGMVIIKQSVDSILLNSGQTLKLDMTNINSINLLR